MEKEEEEEERRERFGWRLSIRAVRFDRIENGCEGMGEVVYSIMVCHVMRV